MFEGRHAWASLSEAQDQQPSWLDRVHVREGFKPDLRFSRDALVERAEELLDSIDLAREEREAALELAFEQGRAEGEAASFAKAQLELAARDRLAMQMQQMDAAIQQALTDRLRETVAALCEQTLHPLACDVPLLQKRCEQAAAALGESMAGLKLHLHPDDIAQIDPTFAASWTIVPDTEAERGSLLLEGVDSGISDGPALWRSQIEAALQTC